MSMHANTVQYRSGRARLVAALAVALLMGVGVLAGCGSSNNTASKPQYCTDKTNLQNSLQGLTNLSASNGLSGLQSSVTQIQSDASALVASASSDFPTESAAVQTAADALVASLQSVTSTPSAAGIASIAKNVSDLSTALQNFSNATKSKCG